MYDGVLIGGMAVALYVEGRIPTAQEIDFLVGSNEFCELYNKLEMRGYDIYDILGTSLGFEFYNLTINGFKIDFLVDRDRNWVDNLNYRIITISGVKIKVVEPEWLVALKYYGLRDKDMEDVVRLF
ncbi:MAG: hypothetical protein QW403_02800 [Candidatus Aenigmatarchaeota archaeon]